MSAIKLLLAAAVGQRSIVKWIWLHAMLVGCIHFHSRVVLPYKLDRLVDHEIVEPSGLAYHPTRKSLFVCSDEGEVVELSLEGSILQRLPLLSRDLEGVAVHSGSGLVYVVEEGMEEVLELQPQPLKLLRTLSIPRSHDGVSLMAAGGQGVEGLTFIPDSADPDGGVFWASNQSFDLNSESDRSVIVRLRVPKEGTTVVIEAVYPMSVVDISALEYRASSGDVLAVSDAANVLLVLGRDGVIKETWAFPGDDQEGLALDEEGNIFIAQDSGGIARYVATAPW